MNANTNNAVVECGTTTYVSVLTKEDHFEKAENHAKTLARILLLPEVKVEFEETSYGWRVNLLDKGNEDCCYHFIKSRSTDVELIWWAIDDKIKEVIEDFDNNEE